MALDLVHPPKARPGDRIAVLSPSFAAAGAFPEVHEQAMRRLTEVTGLIPVEYPTTRDVAATPARATGIASFHGGSSQVHLGPGPAVDDIHARSLRAALPTGERLEITDPGESEDVGVDWADPRALDSSGEREATEPWSWHGPIGDRPRPGRLPRGDRVDPDRRSVPVPATSPADAGVKIPRSCRIRPDTRGAVTYCGIVEGPPG